MKTAVEWLVQEINKINVSTEARRFISKLEKQAKEIEKQQQGFNEEEVKNIMAETWIKCVGNDGNDFKETRDKILEQFKKK
jgi:DNA topoisomerase VI subunit B